MDSRIQPTYFPQLSSCRKVRRRCTWCVRRGEREAVPRREVEARGMTTFKEGACDVEVRSAPSATSKKAAARKRSRALGAQSDSGVAETAIVISRAPTQRTNRSLAERNVDTTFASPVSGPLTLDRVSMNVNAFRSSSVRDNSFAISALPIPSLRNLSKTLPSICEVSWSIGFGSVVR
jgi:hypothetical protein